MQRWIQPVVNDCDFDGLIGLGRSLRFFLLVDCNFDGLIGLGRSLRFFLLVDIAEEARQLLYLCDPLVFTGEE